MKPKRVFVVLSSVVGVGCAAATASSPSVQSSAKVAGRGNPAQFFWRDIPVGARHTLMPTPRTVVYGGYDPVATPALRIASGDEVDLGAVSTCGARLLQAGVDSGTIEPAYRAITAAVRDSSLRRGPGGHILTGPVHAIGAEPGDVLEVRIKNVALEDRATR